MNLILAYDIDDTIMSNNRPYTPNIEALLYLQTRMLTVAVTTRPQRLARQVLPNNLIMSGVFSAGAEVSWKGETILQPIPLDIVVVVWKIACRFPNIPFAFESPSILWCNTAAFEKMKSIDAQLLSKDRPPNGITKILVSPAAEALLEENKFKSLSLLSKRSGWNELLAKDVNKASGLKSLCDLVYPNGEYYIIALGDDISDLSFFSISDFSVTTTDAVPRVLETADAVMKNSTSEESNSINKFLQLLFNVVKGSSLSE